MCLRNCFARFGCCSTEEGIIWRSLSEAGKMSQKEFRILHLDAGKICEKKKRGRFEYIFSLSAFSIREPLFMHIANLFRSSHIFTFTPCVWGVFFPLVANVAVTQGIAINGTFSMNILYVIMQKERSKHIHRPSALTANPTNVCASSCDDDDSLRNSRT